MSDIEGLGGTGSLTFSSLLDKSKVESAPGDSIAKEVEELEEQIADVTELLETLTLQSQDRKNRYVSEINDLNAKIAKFKAKADREYQRLVESQDTEYEAAALVGTSEVNRFVNSTNGIDSTCREWNNLSKHINQLQADIELGAVQRKFGRLQNDALNTEILKKSRVVEREIAKEMKREQQEASSAALHEEILRIGANIRQQSKQYDILLSECEQVQDALVRYHKGCLDNLSEEARKREGMFEKHLAVLKNRLKTEQEKCETEVQMGRELIENLNAIKRDTSKRCSQQLQIATRDIERINALLERQETPEADREAMSRSETLQRTNAALTRQLRMLEEELDGINGKIASANDELARSTTSVGPKKTPKQLNRYSVF